MMMIGSTIGTVLLLSTIATITTTIPITHSQPLQNSNNNELLHISGSGTTNPSKCYWSLMETLHTQISIPTHLTYRAVGSSTGQAELINDPTNDNTSIITVGNTPLAYFSSGDVPLNINQYNAFSTANKEIIHLPLLLGTVSFFHSIPSNVLGNYVMLDNDNDSVVITNSLNLTACTLAKIYTGQIITWDDTAITDSNPNMVFDANMDTTITVYRRVKGSSSTNAITNYMRLACPDEFPDSLVGTLPDWATDAPDLEENVIECSGSSGMMDCLQDTTRIGIGYADSGHGHSEDVHEVQIQNKDGTWLTSKIAAANDGIAVNADNDLMPNSTTDDFSKVSFMYLDGEYTWPMTLLTYIYVRNNMTEYIVDPMERALVIAFLEMLYDDDYISKCIDDYSFTLPTTSVRELGISGIELLKQTSGIVNETNFFFFEKSTTPITGAGTYVISTKRKSTIRLEINDMMESIIELKTSNTLLQDQLYDALYRIELLETMVSQHHDEINNLGGTLTAVPQPPPQTTTNTGSNDHDHDDDTEQQTSGAVLGATSSQAEQEKEDDQDKRIKASMALSIMSFCLWVVFGIVTIIQFAKKP